MTTYLRWSEEKALEAYNCRLAGMTSQQIANSWGVSRNVIVGLVWRARKQFNLAPLPAKWRKPRSTTKRVKRERQVKVYKALSAPRVVLDAPPAAPEPLYITLLDLERQHCRWPVGLGHGLQSTYCGHTKLEESSYCPHHHMRSTRDIRSKT